MRYRTDKGCGVKQPSPFNWRGQPSITGVKDKRHVVLNPNTKFNGPMSSSIATPEKRKQKPAHGAFKTA